MQAEKIESLLNGMFYPLRVDRGSLIFSEGNLCSAVPFVKDGELKVYLISDSGRELTLYRVMPGQMCILAMITVYTAKEYPAYTKAEKDSLVFMVPTDNSLLSESVEERLISYLLSKAEGNKFIEKTHEEIAKDVGSVRVVVSRVLKELEKDGLIELCRGRLFIKDYEALKRRAGYARQ